MNYIVFDVETYSPNNLDKIDTSEMRVSVCGAYFSWSNQYVAFFEEDMKDFLELTKESDLVVGYNHVGFDLPVLQKYVGWNLQELPNYDILTKIYESVGFRLKLDDICKANFDTDIKTDSYESYKHYYQEGKMYELTDYCMNDVRLTKQVLDKIRREGKLNYYDLHQQKEMEIAQPQPGQVNLTAQSDTLL